MSHTITRRDFVCSAALAAASAVLAASPVARSAVSASNSPAVAAGTVFDDVDGSGKFAPSKRGVAGVRVSNGRDVVTTDANGRYSIPLPENSTLFVIKPRDWMTPVSAEMLPRFFYHYYPTGSPQWRPDPKAAPKEAFDPQWYFPGIPPSGPLPAAIDFPLVRHPEPDRFRTIVFGDPQPGTDDQLDWMSRTVIQELIGVKDVAFGITVGDVVNVSRLNYFLPVNQLVSSIGVPWYNISGNHDQNLIVPDDSQSCATFQSIYGPTTFAFDYGPVSFVAFKNIIRRPFAGFAEAHDGDGGFRPMGDEYDEGIQPDQLAFLKNYIATVPRDRMLVLLMHAPIGNSKLKNAKPYEREIFQLLSGRPHTLSISGHTHVQAHYFAGQDRGFDGPGEHHHFNSICVRGAGYRGPLDETQTPSCMASDGCEQGYSFITFNGTSYDIEYKAARRAADHQMNIFVPAMIAVDSVIGTEVQANIFAGSSRSKVELKVGNRPAVPMEFAPKPDPAMLETLRLQRSKTPWLGPQYKEEQPKTSRHIWHARLPNLPLGSHVVEVHTTDMFGKTYIGRRPIRVVPRMA